MKKHIQEVIINRMFILIISAFMLISILQKPRSSLPKIGLTTSIVCLLYLQIIQPTPKKLAVRGSTSVPSPELNVLSGGIWLQLQNPNPTLTLKAFLLIAMILFLFVGCPYIVGRIFSTEPGWTEEEQEMRRELPPEVIERWDKVFPRQSPETTITAIQAEDSSVN